MNFVDDRHSTNSNESPQIADWIKTQEVPVSALKRFLEQEGFNVPSNDAKVRDHVSNVLSDDGFELLKNQFRFAGRQSLNYFVITGISENVDILRQKARSHFPTHDEVQGIKDEPYLTSVEEVDGRLYLIFGYYQTTKTHDPETGAPIREMLPDECVLVVRPDTDLVEVRTSDTAMARQLCQDVSSSLGNRVSDNTLYKPDFGYSFQEEFNEYINKYYNLKVRVREKSEGSVGTIQFNSRKDEDDEYMDVRKDERVQTEIEDNDGEISQGYVELVEDIAFNINRPQSKLFVRQFALENTLNEITEIIDNVIRQSEGYSQGTIQGFGNVPE